MFLSLVESDQYHYLSTMNFEKEFCNALAKHFAPRNSSVPHPCSPMHSPSLLNAFAQNLMKRFDHRLGLGETERIRRMLLRGTLPSSIETAKHSVAEDLQDLMTQARTPSSSLPRPFNYMFVSLLYFPFDLCLLGS